MIKAENFEEKEDDTQLKQLKVMSRMNYVENGSLPLDKGALWWRRTCKSFRDGLHRMRSAWYELVRRPWIQHLYRPYIARLILDYFLTVRHPPSNTKLPISFITVAHCIYL